MPETEPIRGALGWTRLTNSVSAKLIGSLLAVMVVIFALRILEYPIAPPASGSGHPGQRRTGQPTSSSTALLTTCCATIARDSTTPSKP